MKHFDRKDIDQLDKIFRLNLINSVTGIKPANLIGTQSEEGQTNLAIFSSVIHLGSNPPLIGMVTRPTGEVPRHTFENIRRSGVYTINAVPLISTKAAHYTSAKFEEGESEFEACGFNEKYIDGFAAPFVEESPMQLGLKLRQELPIALNGTIMLIGEVEHVFVDENAISEQGYLDLEKLDIAGISGLNTYYSLEKSDEYPYVRKGDWSKL